METVPRSIPPAVPIQTLHSRVIFSLCIVFFAIAIVAVLLRVWARHIKRTSLAAEDYLVFSALLAYFAQIILVCFGVIYGAAGHPQSRVSFENVKIGLQCLAGEGVCYGFGVTCSKWSICLLYKRLFATRSFRIATYCTMVLIFLWGIYATVVTWAFCSPVAYGWDPTIAGGHCANRTAGLIVAGVVDAITDLIILILPMPIIWSLQIPRMKQVSLAIVFSIAILSTVISALRAYFATLINFNNFTDSSFLLYILSIVEPATSIMVASSLVYGPIIQRYSRATTPSSHSLSKKRTLRSFRRIYDNGLEDTTASLELEQTKTTIQGGGWHQAQAKGNPGTGDITVQRSFFVEEDTHGIGESPIGVEPREK